MGQNWRAAPSQRCSSLVLGRENTGLWPSKAREGLFALLYRSYLRQRSDFAFKPFLPSCCHPPRTTSSSTMPIFATTARTALTTSLPWTSRLLISMWPPISTMTVLIMELLNYLVLTAVAQALLTIASCREGPLSLEPYHIFGD